jgi:hypothetical protein
VCKGRTNRADAMTRVVSADKNRRRAVRVHDRILVGSRKIDQQRYSILAENYRRGVSLYNLEEADELALYLGTRAALLKVREKDEDLADFLQHLDAKLNRVLALVSTEPSPLDRLDAQDVSISGTGIAFWSAEEIGPGDILGLQLVLLPQYAHIYTIAKVISTEQPEDMPDQYKCRAACEYILMLDADRESIVQNVFKRQQLALRHNRLKKGEAEKRQ